MMSPAHGPIGAIVLAVSALALTACSTAENDQSEPRAGEATATGDAINYQALVEQTDRPDKDRAADPYRKPAEMLEFAGVKPGMAVFEMLPGGGYFTRLFTSAVGPSGRVVAWVPDEMLDSKYKPYEGALALAEDPALSALRVEHSPVAGPVPDDLAEHFDVVWTSRNYHDFHNLDGFDARAANGMVYDLLKPGGTYIVLDHSAPDGSGLAATGTTHRIDADTVRKEVESAGFLFDAASTALANPDDSRTGAVFAPELHNKTDQFVLRFRKPG